jgi:hypothetical protein
MSPNSSWEPTFPAPGPEHWVALVNTSRGIRLVADVSLDRAGKAWLRDWLERHVPHNPADDASYVYLALSGSWINGPADGRVSAAGVIGTGSGAWFDEPPDAVVCTVDEIRILAIAWLDIEERDS